MTNPSMQALNMPYMTPRVKKRAAMGDNGSTTTGRKIRRVGSVAKTTTASRSEINNNVRTPKATMTPRTSYLTPQRLCFTPSAGDRFIPNRAKTDAAKARRSLLQSRSAKTVSTKPQSQSESDYSCQLGKVLFGADDDCNGVDSGSLMNFGAMVTPQRRNGDAVSKKDVPSDHGLLPTGVLSQARRQTKKKAERTAVSISFSLSLDAPGMVQDTDVKLMDCEEDFTAIALNDKVYVRDNDGRTEMVAHMSGSTFACVRFSETGEYLALGQDESLQIYGLWEDEEPSMEYELFHHSGYVTAVAWNGTQIVAASDDGIKRCDLSRCGDLSRRVPLTTTYVGHGENVPVTVLEWNGNTIASAGMDGKIKLWDANATGDAIEPLCTMDHPGVCTLEFCPQQPGLLVSGGLDGLRFWKVRNGELKATIETETPVVGTMFSKTHKEICVADEQKLTVWSLGSQVTKLAEKEIVFSREEDCTVTGMARGPNGTVLLSTDEEAISYYRVERKVIGKEKRTTGTGFGGLQMPVIR